MGRILQPVAHHRTAVGHMTAVRLESAHSGHRTAFVVVRRTKAVVAGLGTHSLPLPPEQVILRTALQPLVAVQLGQHSHLVQTRRPGQRICRASSYRLLLAPARLVVLVRRCHLGRTDRLPDLARRLGIEAAEPPSFTCADLACLMVSFTPIQCCRRDRWVSVALKAE